MYLREGFFRYILSLIFCLLLHWFVKGSWKSSVRVFRHPLETLSSLQSFRKGPFHCGPFNVESTSHRQSVFFSTFCQSPSSLSDPFPSLRKMSCPFLLEQIHSAWLVHSVCQATSTLTSRPVRNMVRFDSPRTTWTTRHTSSPFVPTNVSRVCSLLSL